MPWVMSVAKALVFLLSPLAVASPRSPAPMLPLLAVALVYLCYRSNGRLPDIRIPGTGALAIFFGWALISISWTLLPGGELKAWLGVTSITLCGLALGVAVRNLSGDRRIQLAQFFVAGFVVALGMLVFERVTGGAIEGFLREMTGREPMELNRIKPNLTILTLFVWPAAALVLVRGKIHSLALLVVTAIVIASFGGTSTILTIVVGVIVFVLAMKWPHRMGIAICIFLVGIVPFTPVIPKLLPAPEAIMAKYPNFPYHNLHRMVIWAFAADAVWEHPLRGWGFDSSRDLVAHKEAVGELVLTGPGITGTGIPHGWKAWEHWVAVYKNHPLPLHPHNFILQIWLELGGIGAALGALAAWRMTKPLRDSISPVQPWTVAALAVGASAALMNYGVWQSWWLSTIFLTFALVQFSAADDMAMRMRGRGVDAPH